MRRLNLRIGPRIFLGFSFAALLTLLVAVVSISYLRGVGQRLTTVAEQDRLLQTSALELRIAVEEESDGVRGYLLSGDKTLLEPFTRGRSEFATTGMNLQGLVQSDEDTRLLSEVDTLHSAFLSIAEEQITLHDHGFPKAAVFLWQRRGNEVKGSLNSKLAEFIALQEQTISARTLKARNEQNQALAISLVLVGLAWVVGIAGGIWISRSITNPIRRLVSATEDIGKGDLTTRVAASGRDELASLGSAMNQMVKDLDESRKTTERLYRQEQHRADQMRAINEIGRQISSVLSLDELLPYVASLVQETFDYYNVNVFLVDPGSDYLVLRAGAGGYEGAVPVGQRLKVGAQGIVGWVGQAGEPLLACDVSREPRYLFVEELGETRSELAVPIKVGDEIVGVLDVESSELDAFDKTDVSTAQTLADQIAIAIENARLNEQTREMAVMAERNRMAREIHDTLAQGFTGIVLQLEAAEQALEESPAEVPEHLSRAKNLARESLQEARRSVWDLLPRALEQRPLEAALHEHVRLFAAAGREKASFSLSGDRRDLPSNVQAALLRICQESLTNIRRHARATVVRVNLTFYPEAVCLRIEDNGTGFDFEAVKTLGSESGFGLAGMEERARLIGGTLAVRSREGEGTSLEVQIPTA